MIFVPFKTIWELLFAEPALRVVSAPSDYSPVAGWTDCDHGVLLWVQPIAVPSIFFLFLYDELSNHPPIIHFLTAYTEATIAPNATAI